MRLRRLVLCSFGLALGACGSGRALPGRGAFALGRPLGPNDMASVYPLTSIFQRRGADVRDLIVGVTKTAAFLQPR